MYVSNKKTHIGVCRGFIYIELTLAWNYFLTIRFEKMQIEPYSGTPWKYQNEVYSLQTHTSIYTSSAHEVQWEVDQKYIQVVLIHTFALYNGMRSIIVRYISVDSKRTYDRRNTMQMRSYTDARPLLNLQAKLESTTIFLRDHQPDTRTYETTATRPHAQATTRHMYTRNSVQGS